VASTKKQTPSPTTTQTTTAGTNTPSADAYAAQNQLPTGGTTDQTGQQGPGYLGTGSLINQSGGDIVIYEDGTSGRLNPDGSVPKKPGANGQPQKSIVIHPDQVVTDVNGQPMPYQAPVDTSALGGTPYVPIPAVSYVPAKYRAGDEVKELGDMAPEMRAQVIAVMRDKGLLPDNATPNDWWSAMRQVMSMANSTGNDWQTELQQMPTVQTKAQQPNVYKYTLHDPADLRAIFNKAATDVAGGGVPQSEIDKMVAGYQAYELGLQTKEKNAAEVAGRLQAGPATGAELGQTGTVMPGPNTGAPNVDMNPVSQSGAGGPITTTSTQQMDPTTFAQNMLRQDMGGEVNKYALLGTYNTFMNLIANGIR
jgi:hypothetical protein